MTHTVVQNVRFSHLAKADHRYERLAHILLAHGGRKLMPMPEDNLDLLIADGEYREAKEVRFWEGQANECHTNCIFLAAKDPTLMVMTGYGLSDDGLWRQHSWCYDGSGVIVETVLERVAYFGVPDPEAKKRVAMMQRALSSDNNSVLPGLPS